MAPIVLHHGLLGFGNFRVGKFQMRSFKGIDDALLARGHALIVTRVHPTGSIELRARQLKEALLAQWTGEKLVIVAHSMGGLDARHMIAHLGMAERIAALITISTPHRGSAYADWCLRNLGRRLRVLTLARMLHLDVDAMTDLTTEHCAAFNERTPDVPGVRYCSISACRPWYQVPPWAMHSWRVIHAAEGANDGLVSVRSAVWGEHLETWSADHWHTINKRFVPEFKGRATGDITPHYLRVLERVLRAES